MVRKLILVVLSVASLSLIGCGASQDGEPQGNVSSQGEASSLSETSSVDSMTSLFTYAQELYDNGDYDASLKVLDSIDNDWAEYVKVELLIGKITSIKSLQTLEQYETNQDYAAIITYVTNQIGIVNADAEVMTKYTNAIAEYKKQLNEKVETYLSSNDYVSATALLENAKVVLGEDEDLINQIDGIKKSEIITLLDAHIAEGNYASAIQLANEKLILYPNDENLTIKLRQCEASYREQIIAEARKAYDKEGYSSAVSILANSVSVLPNDEVLLAEKEKYMACAPMSLRDVVCLDSHNTSSNCESLGIVEDAYGNSYSDYYTFHLDTMSNLGTYAIYVIEGKYEYFRGILFNWGKNEKRTISQVKIYADDLLIFDSGAISKTSKAQNIDVKINYADQLKIVVTCLDHYGPLAGDITFLSDAEFYNTLSGL